VFAKAQTLSTTKMFSTAKLERFGILYARVALGSAFLSAVGSRLGLYGGPGGHFARFIQYTAEVNSFMPAATIPFLAVAATIAETSLGILLILGLWPRWVALGAAGLLAVFGTAMAISFGIKSPMDYSVFSASSGALLLSLYQERSKATTSSRPECEQELQVMPSTHQEEQFQGERLCVVPFPLRLWL
jgi:putative oxidoreductase